MEETMLTCKRNLNEEQIYETAFKDSIERRLSDLEQRLYFLEQALEVQKREYTNA